MKQKIKHDHSIHQRVERILAHKFCVFAVLGLLSVAALGKTDSKVFFVMRAAYAQGFGKVSEYMREEPARMHFGVAGLSRNPTISGQ